MTCYLDGMTRKKSTIPRRSLGFIRVRALRARKAGMRVNEIARAIGVHPNSVSRWIMHYERYGSMSMRPKKSSGRPRKIDCGDLSERLKKVVRRPATDFGFESPLWNSERIRHAMHSELGLKLSKSTVWRALREIGLSYQKPEIQAFEQDRAARKNWLEKEWPKIRRKAKKERAVILFADEASVALLPTAGKTWAKIGKTPIIRLTGKRGSISVISAISTTGKLLFKIPKKTVKSDEFITFIKQVMREIKRKKIYMIVDRGASHTAKKTKNFVASLTRFELLFLPAYSPDFNPDEYTWGHLKNVDLKSHTERTTDGLRLKTRNKMKSIQKKKELVKSFFKRSKLT